MLPYLVVLGHRVLGRLFAQTMDLGRRRRDERIYALVGHGAHREERDGIGNVYAVVEQPLGKLLALRTHVSAQSFEILLGAGNVDLVAHDDDGTVGELGRVERQLALDDLVVLHGIAPLEATRQIDDMQDERRALDVAQELVAQPLALGRPLDETGYVGNREAQVSVTHHAEVGRERGKGIVGDLGTRGRHAGDERALAHGRHAHERGVGHELHLEFDPERVCRLA